MPALSYKARFVDLVASGHKPHSIRAWRKRPFKVGDVLMHYTAMRTKACRKIRPDTLCTAAVPIKINARLRQVTIGAEGSRFYKRGRLNDSSLIALGVLDGFDNINEFFQFFAETHGVVFTGQLVEWNPSTNILPMTAGAAIEKGELVCVRDGAAYPASLAPLSPVPSSPARAGKREPRGSAQADLQPATQRAK